MNNVDKQYLDILRDIIENGVSKETRSGTVKSVFCRTMRFNLREGLPLITTKRVYYKGIIHELLWFINGDTNIKYLVENKVNIWNDDAYRWYCKMVDTHNTYLETGDVTHNTYSETAVYGFKYPTRTKEEFISRVLIDECAFLYDKNGEVFSYNYGDLGPVYGKQWRGFGESKFDQLSCIIDTLKNNPDDRRIMCVAYNPDVLDEVALPPCHISFQFYSRELSLQERASWLLEKANCLTSANKHEDLDNIDINVPRRELSCAFSMRSNDFCCGNPFNIAQYAMLTEMVAHVCGMAVGELVYVGNDVHVYENHIELAKEQLERQGSDTLPRLTFGRSVSNIDDFKFDDFIISNYNPDAAIKYPLSVG